MTKRGTILVVGGGISGISAAIEASEAGADVLLVEKNSYLGGRVAQMNLYFPKLCPPTCGLEINLRRFRSNPKIRYLTGAEVVSLKGEVGKFEVQIRQHPQFVNDSCTVCAACVDVCPAERADSFNLGMSKTKAIYHPFPTAFPPRYVIDADACQGERCSLCVEACAYEAIDLGAREVIIEETVNALIVATGWTPYDASKLTNLGFGRLPDVITNLQMERLAAADGPTFGKLSRPSDGGPLGKVVFVQCAGSRDENHLRHCSGVCCMASLKQARYVRNQYPDAEISIFYIDIRTPGRLEDFYSASKKDEKLFFFKGKVAKVESEQTNLVVEAEDVLSGRRVRKVADLVVLATGMVPDQPSLNGSLVSDEHGFLAGDDQQIGILPAGCVHRPVEVVECVRNATAAAIRALASA